MKRIPQFVALEAENYLKFLCALRYDAEPLSARLSKIICTIGPATRYVEKIEKLMEHGMNIARMNFSHGTHEYHAETMTILRQAIKNYTRKLNYEYPLAIALDTKGPEIRTGLIESKDTGEVELIAGERIKLTPNEKHREKCTKDILYVDYENILKLLQPGNHIFVDDGLISLIVENIEDDAVQCKIENGGLLGSSKGVNLPGIAVDLPAVSVKDKHDLQFAVEQQVDMIFASFIRNAEALHEIRDILGEKGQHIKIISKIENHQGLQNIDAIIDASDGIMVARGDMGIEIPASKVFLAQKTIIARCNCSGKPVICATQMLESMVKKPRPTRAEISDVANAVLDGADCVMLSGETAKGRYPLNCVDTMSNICREAENMIQYRKLYTNLVRTIKEQCIDISHTMSIAAVQAALKIIAAAIVVVTKTGNSAFIMSRLRPHCPIIMMTNCTRTARLANLYRGIFAFICKNKSADENKLEESIEIALENGIKQELIKCGDTVVILVPNKEESGYKDRMFIKIVSE